MRIIPIKAHWECWDACNLHCAFCYRMRERPLDPPGAVKLVEAIAAGGFREIVFAGGDPSLRPDIVDLITLAKSLSLRVEVQTNAHLFRRAFGSILNLVDLFGFSLDGSTPSSHDRIRATADNFRRVLDAIDLCDDAGTAYVVRTVVTRENAAEALGVGALLETRANLRKWSLLEFTAVGDGHQNQDRFRLGSSVFQDVCQQAKAAYPGITIDAYAEASKGGIYFLMKPNGDVYTTEAFYSASSYPAVGNVLSDGVFTCIDRLQLNISAHRARYADLMKPW